MIGFLLISLAGLGLVFAWFIAPWLYRRMCEARLAEVCRRERAIVLSYDDGPGADATPRLLDLFADRGVQAVFFPLGQSIDARPDMARRMVDGGHEVGSHTFEHTNAWKTLPGAAGRDRDRGIAAVDALGGQGTLFRPPYGKLTLAGLIGARLRGIGLAWWTLDSRDSWQRRPADEVVADIDAAGGGIVLMHDGVAYERSGPGHAEYVVDLTEKILDHAIQNGYRLAVLSDILEAKVGGHD